MLIWKRNVQLPVNERQRSGTQGQPTHMQHSWGKILTGQVILVLQQFGEHHSRLHAHLLQHPLSAQYAGLVKEQKGWCPPWERFSSSDVSKRQGPK